MTWFRVDDRAAFHRKIVAAKNEAVGAFFRAGAWSSGEGTDGFIPRDVAVLIAADRIWARLVEVGLVEVEADGWRIHDFLDWNPSAAEIAERREAQSEQKRRAGAAGGRRSGEARRSKREAEPKQAASALLRQEPKRNEAPSRPDPDPDPDPPPSGEGAHASGPALDPPGWAAEVVDAVAMSTGRRVDDLAGVWAVFAAWHARDGSAADRMAWTLWVTREARRGASQAPPLVSAAHPLDADRRAVGLALPDLAELRAAYEAGIREVIPTVSVDWATRADQSLARSVAAHARSRSTGEPLEGERRAAWVRTVAGLYAEHVRDQPDEARYLGPTGDPRALERWLNADAARREAGEVDGSTKRRRA